MVKILVADDHAVVRQGVKQILAEDFKDAVVGEGNTEDVGSQILESSQAIANGLAVNNPFLSE